MENKLGLGNRLKKINPMDDIFNLNNGKCEQIENIPIEMLIHYKEHSFKLYTGQRKLDMIESIKAYGVWTPIIVTPTNDRFYTILAGHNRTECGKEAGLTEMPAIILRNLTKADEKRIVIETNLFQRSFSELTISEKATIISEYYELLKQQGGNIVDIENEMQKFSELSPVGTEDKKGSVSPVGTRQVAQEYSLSKNSIARLLRINMLIQDLKDRVDAEEISIRAGVDLSYLSIDEQLLVENIIKKYYLKIDMKKSSQLKLLAKDSQLNKDEIQSILLSKDHSNDIQIKPIRLKSNIINKYFTEEQNQEEIQDIIEKALEKYFKEN